MPTSPTKLVDPYIIFDIGGQQIRVDGNSFKPDGNTPAKFELNEPIAANFTLTQLNTFMQGLFTGFPAIDLPSSFPSSYTVNLDELEVSSDGIFKIDTGVAFGSGQGWTIFPGLTLNSVGLKAAYYNIGAPTLTDGPTMSGQTLTLAGTNLEIADKVTIGAANVYPNNFTTISSTQLVVDVPTSITVGSSSITVTTPIGTSNSVTVASS